MGNRQRILWIQLVLLLLSATDMRAQANSGLFRCKNQKNPLILSINDSGRTVEGPTCAQIVVNVLHFDADFGKAVTITPGPNLASIFPSSFSPGGATAKAKAESLNEHFNADFANAQLLQKALFSAEAQIRKTGSDTDKYLAKLRALINQTDSVLKTNGPKSVVDLVKDPGNQKEMDDALKAAFNWKTTDEIIAGLQSVQADLNSLPIHFPSNTGTISDPCSDMNIGQLGWTDWDKCRDTDFKLAQSIIAAALTEAAPFTSDGDKAAQFAKKIGIIQFWKNLITTLNVDAFTLQTEVTCGVLFNRNEQTVLKLLTVDRTSIFDGPLAAAQTKDGLLTVTCSSPFAITAGAAFSTIGNRQFAIVKSAPASGTTSVNEFGVTSDSNVVPYPIGMAHARLADWADKRYALHFSFGIGARIAGDSSGGSSPEFLIGPSISFLRTIFVTTGLDVGKKSKLIGGFNVGGAVPTDITAPPVSSSYTEGFGFAITFTKP